MGKIPLFVTGEEQNVLTVINNWLTKDIEDDKYQAIDQFGSPHEICSSEFQSQRSQPLKKKNRDNKKSAKQRIVPLDPLSDVPLPKGFPDASPPKPSDPIDNLYLDDLISKGVSESEIILAGELIKRQKMAEQQRRRRPNVVLTDRDNYDYDFLYYLSNNNRNTGSDSRTLSRDFDLDFTRRNIFGQPVARQSGIDAIFDPIDADTPEFFDPIDYNPRENTGPIRYRPTYRNRFQIPTDLLYYRYNLRPGRRPLRPTTNTDTIFDPVDPATPDFVDYDYDVNVNYDRPLSGTPTPVGVLPEQAVALANTKSRKARLWRKVYYLQYLRELYRRTYADYYNDYYYGIQGSGNLGRLTKSENARDE